MNPPSNGADRDRILLEIKHCQDEIDSDQMAIRGAQEDAKSFPDNATMEGHFIEQKNEDIQNLQRDIDELRNKL
jgi:hypothetical protein